MGYTRKLYSPQDIHILNTFFEQMNADCNLNMSRVVWEWEKGLPCFEMFQPEKTGIWFENGTAAAVLQLSSPWPGCVRADNRSHNLALLLDLIRYGEDTFSTIENERRSLIFIVSEVGNALKNVLINQGYHQLKCEYEPLYYSLEQKIPSPLLPDGFELRTLSDVYDFDKLNKLIWKGFQYDGAVPQIDDDIYPPIKHAWLDYNRELCGVILSSDNNYAAFCGLWYDSNTKTGYLEPMVTAAGYRRRGLGSACLFYSLQILKSWGCKTVFAEPDEEAYEYYRKIGFKKDLWYAYFSR